MKLIFIGDVVGKCGCEFLKKKLFGIKAKYGAELVVVNGENSATGNGISRSSIEMIFQSGADVITTGNHVFQKNESIDLLNTHKCLIRPANYPQGAPGSGVVTVDFGRCSVAVVNLMGTLMLEAIDNPFNAADTIIESLSTPNIIVDFHAEATSEKKAFGYYLANRVTAVFGTHTHVQTADETILNGHTAYITDVGMTGAEDSVIGFDKQVALTRIKDHFPIRFVESESSPFICGVFLEFDEKCGKALCVERFIVR